LGHIPGKGREIGCFGDVFVLQQARVAFDAALGFGAVGCLGSNLGQVAALRGDDTGDQGSQRREALILALGRGRRVVFEEGFTDGFETFYIVRQERTSRLGEQVTRHHKLPDRRGFFFGLTTTT
jgi:hypothetical protein